MKLLNRVQAIGEQESLLIAAMILINFGISIMGAEVSINGIVSVLVGAVLLYVRGHYKTNRWEHVEKHNPISKKKR